MRRAAAAGGERHRALSRPAGSGPYAPPKPPEKEGFKWFTWDLSPRGKVAHGALMVGLGVILTLLTGHLFIIAIIGGIFWLVVGLIQMANE